LTSDSYHQRRRKRLGEICAGMLRICAVSAVWPEKEKCHFCCVVPTDAVPPPRPQVYAELCWRGGCAVGCHARAQPRMKCDILAWPGNFLTPRFSNQNINSLANEKTGRWHLRAVTIHDHRHPQLMLVLSLRKQGPRAATRSDEQAMASKKRL